MEYKSWRTSDSIIFNIRIVELNCSSPLTDSTLASSRREYRQSSFFIIVWNCSRLNSFVAPKCFPFSVTMSKSSRVMWMWLENCFKPILNSLKVRPPDSSSSSLA
jgi:hypothetical protein